MKAVALVLVLAVVCIALFVTGVFSPRRSRKMQRSVDRLTEKGKAKGENNGGKAGDMTAGMLRRMRKAADASARKGRDIHDHLTG